MWKADIRINIYHMIGEFFLLMLGDMEKLVWRNIENIDIWKM